MIDGIRGTQTRTEVRADWSGRLSMAAILAASLLALTGGPIFTLSAEEANMSATDSAKGAASAETDATVIKGSTGGCKVSASASASSTSTSNGETVIRESHKSVTGPCGSATANAKATSTSESGETDENAN
jgi:hypothetical protein